jgi:hypothetical protein
LRLLLIDSEFRLRVVSYDAVFLIERFFSVVPVRLFLAWGQLVFRVISGLSPVFAGHCPHYSSRFLFVFRSPLSFCCVFYLFFHFSTDNPFFPYCISGLLKRVAPVPLLFLVPLVPQTLIIVSGHRQMRRRVRGDPRRSAGEPLHANSDHSACLLNNLIIQGRGFPKRDRQRRPGAQPEGSGEAGIGRQRNAGPRSGQGCLDRASDIAGMPASRTARLQVRLCLTISGKCRAEPRLLLAYFC